MPPAARPLPILWGAVASGGVLAAVVLAAVGRSSGAARPEWADGAFYAVAVLSAVATTVALAVVRRMEGRLAGAPTDEAALQTVRTHGVAALALAEASALAAGVAALLTGNVLTLLFLGPFLAVVGLTWPSEGRVAHWLALRGRR